MSVTQILFAVFAVLLVGVALPLPYGVRMAFVLALIALAVLTFIGGGMQYLMTLF